MSPGKKAFGISILLHTALLTWAYLGVNQIPLRTLRTEGRSEWMVTLRAPQTQPRRKTAPPKIVLTDTLSTHRSSAISNFSTVPTSAGSLALTSYLAEIRRRIEARLTSLSRSHETGERGSVTLRLTLKKQGNLASAEILGFAPGMLGELALRAARESSPLPEFPAALLPRSELRVLIPIELEQ